MTRLSTIPLAVSVKPRRLPLSIFPHNSNPSIPFLSFSKKSHFQASAAKMASSSTKIIDSHLHVWASPEEVYMPQPPLNFSDSSIRTLIFFFFFCECFVLKAAGKYPYFPGQEPTLPGHLQFLLQVCLTRGLTPMRFWWIF